MSGKFDSIVLATDLDGTFVAMTEEGERRNREAIEYFRANGGHFTFATGRSVSHIAEKIEGAVEMTDLPLVCCNGAFLYDLHADREVAVYPMSHVDMRELQNKFAEIAESVEECRGAMGAKRVVYFKEKKYVSAAADKYRAEYVERDIYELMSAEEWNGYDLHKCVFIADGEAVTNMRKHLDPLYEGRLAISQASPKYYEFNGRGVTKATGIANLLRLTFGDRKMTLCVSGDFDNDIEMLKSADYAFCPENANDKVKAVCHKCLCHHKEGLMADIIEYLDREIIK